MAVNSKADKTGRHRSSTSAKPSYSAAPVAGLGIAGQKALSIRAKKVLTPLETPATPAETF